MEGTLGEIRIFAGFFVPRNWYMCNGQSLAIASNTALHSIIGTNYGGDESTFMLPNFNGNTPVGVGTGLGLTPRSLGERGGEENVSLLLTEIPAHNHISTIGGSVGLKVNSGNATMNMPTVGAAIATPGKVVGDNFVSSLGFSSSEPNQEINQGALSPIDVPITGQLTGGGIPHSNMQPFLALNFIICYAGYYPSRP